MFEVKINKAKYPIVSKIVFFYVFMFQYCFLLYNAMI